MMFVPSAGCGTLITKLQSTGYTHLFTGTIAFTEDYKIIMKISAYFIYKLPQQ